MLDWPNREKTVYKAELHRLSPLLVRDTKLDDRELVIHKSILPKPHTCTWLPSVVYSLVSPLGSPGWFQTHAYTDSPG